MNRESPDISVVILCFRAGEEIRPFVSKMIAVLMKRGLSYELVLVANYKKDEAETDQTPRVVGELAAQNPHIVAVAKAKEGMMGWDLRSGLDVASGKTIAFIDGDGQMPVEDIVRVYDELEKSNVDMVVPYRVQRFDGFKRYVISRVYNTLLRILFPKIRLFDANSKPKIFTREAFQRLKLESNDWFIDAEIVIQASAIGLKFSQIPTVFLKSEHSVSMINSAAVFEFIKNLIWYRFFR